MSVDYTAILAYGKEFEDAREVVEFLVDRGQLSEAEEEELLEEGNSYITEILYGRGNLDCQCLNLYRGEGYYLGFGISCRSVEGFEKSFNEAKSMWNALFPNDPAEIIHTVRVS